MSKQTAVEMARRAAELLQGSSQGIANLGEEFEALELNAEFCAELDSLVFCCDYCNWWFEQSEMSDTEDWVCEDCAE